MEIRYVRSAKFIILALLGTIFTSLSYLIYIYNPIELMIPELMKFSPGSLAFTLWENPPYEVLIKIYIYSVRNSEEFLAGKEKLKFKEVGPYIYKEILHHKNATFNDNGTVTFVPQRTLEFLPEVSVGDPHVDTLLSPNIPLLGITASLIEESMFVNLGVSSLSSYLDSQPFLNLTVHEYLYGYDDTLVTLANNFVPNWIDFPRFGILDRLMALDNASNVVTMTVNPKVAQSSNPLLTETERFQPFAIQMWNGSPGFHQWGYKDPENNDTFPTGNSRCNLLEGSYLGAIFPQNIERNSSFRLYRHAFCRTLPVLFEGSEITKDGFEGYTYRIRQDFLARPEENPDNDCFCDEKKCLPKGLGDLSPCYYEIPIVMSQPHFLNADPLLLQQIDGLSPDKEKHDTYLTIHPKMGLPLDAKMRLQINLLMPNTQYNERTKPFNELTLPLFWAEVAVDSVPSNIKLYINVLYHILPIIQQVIMYVMGAVGVLLVFGSALATIVPHRGHPKSQKGLNVTYTEIPVFPVKTQTLKPSVIV